MSYAKTGVLWDKDSMTVRANPSELLVSKLVVAV